MLNKLNPSNEQMDGARWRMSKSEINRIIRNIGAGLHKKVLTDYMEI